MTAPGGPPNDQQGGITQFVKWVLDKTSLDRLATDAQAFGVRVGKQFMDGLKVLATPSERNAVFKGVFDFYSAGIKANVEKTRGAIKMLREEYLSLVKLGKSQPLTVKGEKAIRKKFTTGGVLNQGKYARYIQSVQLGQRIAGASLTKLGQLFNALGGNSAKTSTVLRGAVAQMNALAKGSTAAQQPLTMFQRVMQGATGTALKFATALGLVVTVQKLIGFGKAAITELADLQANWTRLAVVLANFGVSVTAVRPEVQKLVERMLDLGMPAKDTLNIMGTLVGITGRYGASLKAVPVVMDLMIERHMSMEQAARAVGRAIDGDNMLLSRQGIYLDKTRDAVDQLTERYQHAAQERSKTTQGEIAKMSAQWTMFKAALGDSLLGRGGGAGIFDMIISGLKEMRDWVLKNHVAIEQLGNVIGWGFKQALTIGRGFFVFLGLMELAVKGVALMFKEIPDNFRQALADTEQFFLRWARTIARIIDSLPFSKTHLTQDIDALMHGAGARGDDAASRNSQRELDFARRRDELFGEGKGSFQFQIPQPALGHAGPIFAHRTEDRNKDIAMFGRMALSRDMEASINALIELNKLEKQLQREIQQTTKYSKEYFVLQDQIDEIERHKAQVVNQETQDFDKMVQKYERMLEFGIDEKTAREGLAAAMQRELAIANNLSESDDERIKANLRMEQIRKAQQTEMTKTSGYIDTLEKEVKVAETRRKAEQDLVRLRDSLNKKLAEGTIPLGQEVEAKAEIARIDSILKDNAVDLLHLSEKIAEAVRQAKAGRRQEGVAQLEDLARLVQGQLEGTNLTPTERTGLENKLAEIRRAIVRLSEPTLNFKTALKEIFLYDLPQAADTAAKSMLDSFSTAFQYMFRDVRNLKVAFRELPKGLARAITDEIKELAGAKAKENLAFAIESFAKSAYAAATGNFASAAGYATAGAQHLAAGAAWALLAGAAGTLSQSASQSASYYGQQGRSANGVDNARGGDIYLTISGVDPMNPAHQRLVGEAQRQYRERYGGNIILVGAGK